MRQGNKSWDLMPKNLIWRRNVHKLLNQRGHWRDTNTEGELLLNWRKEAENTVWSRGRWLKVATGWDRQMHTVHANGTHRWRRYAIAEESPFQSEGAPISLSTPLRLMAAIEKLVPALIKLCRAAVVAGKWR